MSGFNRQIPFLPQHLEKACITCGATAGRRCTNKYGMIVEKSSHRERGEMLGSRGLQKLKGNCK